MRGVSKTLVIAAIAVIAVIAVGAAYFSGHFGGGHKVLKVGTSPDFPPFEYVDEQGNIVGIDIELIQALAKKIGYDDVEIVSIDFDGLIPALENGQIDVIAAGMTITEERAQKVDFTIPYWDADQAILISKGSQFQPTTLDDLEGKVVVDQPFPGGS